MNPEDLNQEEEYRIADSYDLPPEEGKPEPLKNGRSAWQQTKESWYDKVPLTLKQLDVIIACGIGALILVSVLIALEAAGFW